jgi:hypothetical protein
MVIDMGKWLLAILLTYGADPRSELVFVDPTGSTVAARFEHLPDGSVHGRMLPGTHAAVVVADRAESRDRSFAGVLLRVEAGKPPSELCDRVFHASTPLVTSDGRVFVERGRPGPALEDQLRVDDLTIDEVGGFGTRVVWRGRGYTSHLAGAFGHELIVYLVTPGGASLVGVDMESGRARAIVRDLLPFARDFRVDGNQLVYSNRAEDHRWVIERLDLTSGARTRLHSSAHQAIAPHPYRGDIAYNDGGLRLLSGKRLAHRDGSDVMVAAMGELAALLHYAGGLPTLEIVEGERVRQIATPGDAHIQVVGFVK